MTHKRNWKDESARKTKSARKCFRDTTPTTQNSLQTWEQSGRLAAVHSLLVRLCHIFWTVFTDAFGQSLGSLGRHCHLHWKNTQLLVHCPYPKRSRPRDLATSVRFGSSLSLDVNSSFFQSLTLSSHLPPRGSLRMAGQPWASATACVRTQRLSHPNWSRRRACRIPFQAFSSLSRDVW